MNGHLRAQHAPEPVAIISSACRLPGHVHSPHKLWELLQSGGTAVSNEVPPSRFDAKGHFDGSGRPGTMKALSGMFIEDIDPAAFDAAFFNLTWADATAMDPQQRQVLEVVYECLENGGIPMEKVAGRRVGCYVGSSYGDYQDMQNRDPEQRIPGIVVGTARAMLSNRVSHFFNLKGSSVTVDTACSSGLVALDMACRNVRAGIVEGAIVAGVNLWLSPEHTQERGTMRAAYSESGKCHAFDAKADGYCRSEAVNSVYLKRLSDAIRDGDPIRAVIRGTASNSDGWTPGINSPSGELQATMIREAYRNAGIDESHLMETGYLECHGTGTPAGDPIEVQGAASVLAHMRPPSSPLIIGSVKSNVGHSEAGAGLSGLIKAMMAVEEGHIPGNATFFEPNPAIDFEGLRVRAINRVGIPWPEELNHYRRASVNSFGFGGSNAHAVLDNVDHYVAKYLPSSLSKMPRPHVSSYTKSSDMLSSPLSQATASKTVTQRPTVLVFSANDDESLKRQLKSISIHVLHPRVQIKLSDLAYTLSNRRSRHFCRCFLLAYPNKSGHVRKILVEGAQFANRPPEPVRIGLVFTGQGAQWSQMGLQLVTTFPETALLVLEELNTVLQELPVSVRPTWSLFQELTEPRSPEHLIKPEFSQPLVTALQLAQLDVLESWNIRPEVVVGHSSGEIAAACSAGLITRRQAILVAYFRGFTAKNLEPTYAQGMLAVGMGKKGVRPYINDANTDGANVSIACYNSPASVTLSGSAAKLRELETIIKQDGHFSRMLKVEVAYHSYHMNEVADCYEKLLEQYAVLQQDGESNGIFQQPQRTMMMSTVTERVVGKAEVCRAAYWKANMVSPVRFEGACRKMMTDKKLAPNFLIELGPSDTLSGPVGQIVKEVGIDALTYTSANKRGQEDTSREAIFNVAGHLFLQNADFSLKQINVDAASTEPRTIVDLPNYAWNHERRFWHESLASRDWRFKRFPAHDLLGNKVLGTLWQSPSWHRVLRLEDMPWLRDHCVASYILFPAACFVVMAVEAVRQTTMVTATSQVRSVVDARDYQYCLRNLRFPKGLVLKDDVEVHLMLLLVPRTNMGEGWWEFKITSLQEPSSTAVSSSSGSPLPANWTLHSTGLIRIELSPGESSIPLNMCRLLLDSPTPGHTWYKAFRDSGIQLGPNFQKMMEIEGIEGEYSSRCLVSLEPPLSKWEPQSEYPIHPSSLDSCFQTTFTSLHRNIHAEFDRVLALSAIGEMTISGRTWKGGEALSLTSSDGKSGNASVYHAPTGRLITEIKQLSLSPVSNDRSRVYVSHTYAQLLWQPDLRYLDTDERLQQALSLVKIVDKANRDQTEVRAILDLAAHKTPNCRVLECNLVPGNSDSLWLEATQRPVRSAVSGFHFATNEADALLAVQEQNSECKAAQSAQFSVLDPFSNAFSMPPGTPPFDLIVIRWSQPQNADEKMDTLATNLHRLASEHGTLVFYDASQSENESLHHGSNGIGLVHMLRRLGLTKIRQNTSGTCLVAEIGKYIQNPPSPPPPFRSNGTVAVVRFSPDQECKLISQGIVPQLRACGWDVVESCIDRISDLAPASTVLVLDEMSRPVMATATEREWTSLQAMVKKQCNLVWVTQGSQIRPTEPLKAIAHGLFRTVRAENPMVRIVTVDVELASMVNLPASVRAIDIALKEVVSLDKNKMMEGEVAERAGLLYVSRVRPDQGVNKRKVEDATGGPAPVMIDFHGSRSTIHLVPTRPGGGLDALGFAEKSSLGGLAPNDIEVELMACGCSSQDVHMARGNKTSFNDKDQGLGLGLEGAGIVVKVGSSVTNRRITQRVAVFGRGCFANRVIVSSKATMVLPDDMTFEEAATLPVAFLSALLALVRIARAQKGDRVLIHSASTDCGMACIRLCQHLGCIAFATVDGPEQREALAQQVGLSEQHIFNSTPTTSFPRALQNVTKDRGVDIIISQSANAGFEYESSRLLAPGGRLIRLSSGDTDANNLVLTASLVPNCSFQTLNITALPLETIESLFSELSHLVVKGSVRPLSPCTRLGYQEIPEALRLIRQGTDVGKVIISNGDGAQNLVIPSQPEACAAKSLIHPEHAYLLVGGLRGICGHLAIHLVSQGAKHIAIMSRTGHQDDISRSIARKIKAMGGYLDLLQGDVTSVNDVRRVFKDLSAPVGAIIQGAAVFKNKTFKSMSQADFQAALSCKVQGTWNLHQIALETKQPISLFIMLSSISGIVGSEGMANYAAANAFLDAFAEFRRASGLPAISIDLGPVEDIGYMRGDNDSDGRRIDERAMTSINEGLLRRILDYAVLQQHPDPKRRLNADSQAQMLTGLLVPQAEDSNLLRDVRFRGLLIRSQEEAAGPQETKKGTTDTRDKPLQVLLLLVQSRDPDPAQLRAAAVSVVGTWLAKLLRTTEGLDPTRPLSYFGMDSLVAAQLQDWGRTTLHVELTTSDVMDAASLGEICDTVVRKMHAAA